MVFYVCNVIVVKPVSDVMLPMFMMSSFYVCGGVIMFVVSDVMCLCLWCLVFVMSVRCKL